MSLRVFGDMHQQAEHSRRQTLFSDVARLVQHSRLDGADSPLGIAKVLVDVSQKFGQRRRTRSGFLLERGDLSVAQLIAAKVRHQTVDAVGDVAQMETERGKR